MNNRRDFLKAAGLTLSGAILSSCNTSPNAAPPKPGSDGILPNGYRFFRLKGNSDVLPGGAKGQQLRPDAGLDAQGRVVYGAIDQSDQIGLYALQVGMQGDTPRVLREDRLVRTGDVLDGRRVVELNAYDQSSQGHLALVVKVETEMRVNTVDEHGNFDGGTAPMRMQALYCDYGQGLTRVLREHLSNAEGHEFAGMFGDVDLHQDGNLIFVANYYHNTGQGRKEVRQGVFLLKGLDGRQAQLVVASGAPLAASTAAPSISHFGLLSLHDGGQFVVQTHLNPPAGVTLQSEGALQTAVLRGNLGAIGPASLRTGSPSNLQIEASSISSGLRPSSRASGLTIFGPRSGPNNSFAHVLNQGDSSLLLINNREVMRTGDRSPSGETIHDITTPQLATDGVTFFVVSTRSGSELLVTNGQQTRSILQSGDLLVNHSSPVGRSICLGFTATHSDDHGRLVFVVDHDDASQSVVMGLPL